MGKESIVDKANRIRTERIEADNRERNHTVMERKIRKQLKAEKKRVAAVKRTRGK